MQINFYRCCKLKLNKNTGFLSTPHAIERTQHESKLTFQSFSDYKKLKVSYIDAYWSKVGINDVLLALLICWHRFDGLRIHIVTTALYNQIIILFCWQLSLMWYVMTLLQVAFVGTCLCVYVHFYCFWLD